MWIGIVGKINWIIVIHFNFSLAEEDTPLARGRGKCWLPRPRNERMLIIDYGAEGRMSWLGRLSHPTHLLLTMRSTSTEESILKVVMSLTTEDGHITSITLLWILISYLSQVLVPSPHGDFLVVTLKIFVGILTGPLVSNPLFLALEIISLQASSKCLTILPLSCTLDHTNRKG